MRETMCESRWVHRALFSKTLNQHLRGRYLVSNVHCMRTERACRFEMICTANLTAAGHEPLLFALRRILRRRGIPCTSLHAARVTRHSS